MTTQVGQQDTMGVRKIVKGNAELAGNELYEAMLAQINDPRLYAALKELYTKYCHLKSGFLFLAKSVPFEEVFEVKEWGALSLTPSGFLLGEVKVHLMFENGVSFGVKYTGSHFDISSAKLEYSLNDSVYTDFEAMLKMLKSPVFAQATFPEGFAKYRG